MEAKAVNSEAVRRVLDELGITPSDTVVMHTSLKKIGDIEGRAEGLLRYFTDYLCDGLYIVPTHTWANVNLENPVYDVRSTKPCIGVFPTVCAAEAVSRNGRNAVRSLHPTHSVAAFGKDAAEYVEGELDTHSRTPRNGVWGRLFDRGAKVLLVGVGLERNTYIHSVDEDINGLPKDERLYFNPTVIDMNGMPHKMYNMCTEGPWSSDDFPLFEDYFKSRGVLSYSHLGNAKVTCFDVRKGYKAIIDLYRDAENPSDLKSVFG